MSSVWAVTKLSRKCYNATSVKAARAGEIRTARHLESINDNKKVKVERGFFFFRDMLGKWKRSQEKLS